MKKNKRFSIFTVVVSILFANASLGQGIYSNSVIQTNYPTSKCGHNERKNKNELNIISLNSVNAVNNPLLIAKFSILFPLAIDMRWTGNGTNFWVGFNNNGQKTMACFNAKGKVNYAIATCSIDKLPALLQSTIVKEYSDYRIFHASEIKANDNIMYRVILENDSNFTTLEMTDEGIEKIQQVKKTNQ